MRQCSVFWLVLLAGVPSACRRHDAMPPEPAAGALSPGEPDVATGRVHTGDDNRIGLRPDDPILHQDASVTPTVHIGNMNVVGGLDTEIVRRVLNRYAPLFATCPAPRLAGAALTRWMVGLHFEIGADGTVRTAARRASMPPDAEFTDCLTLVCRGLEFPRPTDRATVTVDVTLGSAAH